MDEPLMKMMVDIIKQMKHDKKMLIIALIVSIFLNFAEAITFGYFYSQWDYQTTTTTTEQTVDGDEGSIINGDQYNDDSQNRSNE